MALCFEWSPENAESLALRCFTSAVERRKTVHHTLHYIHYLLLLTEVRMLITFWHQLIIHLLVLFCSLFFNDDSKVTGIVGFSTTVGLVLAMLPLWLQGLQLHLGFNNYSHCFMCINPDNLWPLYCSFGLLVFLVT